MSDSRQTTGGVLRLTDVRMAAGELTFSVHVDSAVAGGPAAGTATITHTLYYSCGSRNLG